MPIPDPKFTVGNDFLLTSVRKMALASPLRFGSERSNDNSTHDASDSGKCKRIRNNPQVRMLPVHSWQVHWTEFDRQGAEFLQKIGPGPARLFQNK